MKIGLVRHFKVDINTKAVMSNEEFSEWNHEYDVAQVKNFFKEPHHLDWKKCYCSDLPRAKKTAKFIYDGEAVKSELLREVPMAPFTKKRMKLPSTIWFIFSRVAWRMNHRSQIEGHKQTIKRMNDFFDAKLKDESEDILIVSHGFFLRYFMRMLKSKGFKGTTVNVLKNGELHIFEK